MVQQPKDSYVSHKEVPPKFGLKDETNDENGEEISEDDPESVDESSAKDQVGEIGDTKENMVQRVRQRNSDMNLFLNVPRIPMVSLDRSKF